MVVLSVPERGSAIIDMTHVREVGANKNVSPVLTFHPVNNALCILRTAGSAKHHARKSPPKQRNKNSQS